MLVTLADAKAYLRVDSSDEDAFISQLIQTSEYLIADILRADTESLGDTPAVLRTAELFSVAYLYEHREDADHRHLMETLKNLLFAQRKEIF